MFQTVGLCVCVYVVGDLATVVVEPQEVSGQ